MDYLLRDAYFTGVATGRYDAEQLVASLRLIEVGDRLAVGIDRRGVVALESFVMARYMMFASVYFHHTTRMFEHVLHRGAARAVARSARARRAGRVSALGRLPRAQRPRRTRERSGARAARPRQDLSRSPAEFNAERDLQRVRSVRSRACANASEPRTSGPTHRRSCFTGFRSASAARPPSGSTDRAVAVDAREVSDLIAKLSGKAYWRKLFVRRPAVDVREARRICASIVSLAGTAP